MKTKIFTAEGLVLRTRPLGEADRLLTLLTLPEGKFKAVARGARKIKSRLAAGVDLFCSGRFTFHRGRTWPIVTGCETENCFPWFREDPFLYPYGLYFAELIDRLVEEEEPCPEVFWLLQSAWELCGGGVDLFLLCRSFELKLALLLGYRPHLQSCAGCGVGEPTCFGPRRGGALCSACREGGALPIGPGTLNLARRLLDAPLQQVGVIRATAAQKTELSAVIGAFLNYHLDPGELKSRRLLPE